MSILAAVLLSAVAPEHIDCLAKNESPTGETDRVAFYLTPDKLEKAEPSFNEYDNSPVLNLKLTAAGNAEFIKLQEGRVEKSIALCLGNDLLTEPRLNEPIYGGSMQISGGFSIKETNDIAIRMNEPQKP